jgi:sulfotransferase
MIFFQSSMPRAGSTLLQNILGQNPDFYVTPTSGALELLYGARMNYTNNPEFKAQDSELMSEGWKSFCKAGLEGWFKGLTDKKHIVDKSRGWGINYNFLNSFYPDPKIVCMVRDPRQIFSSMEKNFRKSQDKHQDIQNPNDMQGITTEQRVVEWANSPPVGLALNRIKDMLLKKTPVLYIRFEDLTERPQETMNKIYDYYGVERYEHDFNNIEQLTQEDDAVYGAFGDHTIRRKVKPLKKDYIDILGEDGSRFISENLAWYMQEFNY